MSVYILVVFFVVLADLAMRPIDMETIADTFDKNESGTIDLHKIMSTLKLPDAEIIDYEVQYVNNRLGIQAKGVLCISCIHVI